VQKQSKIIKNCKILAKMLKNARKWPFFEENRGKIAVFEQNTPLFSFRIAMSQKMADFGDLIGKKFAFSWNHGRVKDIALGAIKQKTAFRAGRRF
jgi:hypothetical protein